MVVERATRGQATAVLCSAGLDSAVLVALEARTGPVVPVYVAVGFAWEAAEQRALERLFAAGAYGGQVDRPVTLALDMRDVYAPSHWAVRGDPPGYHTPDEDVYLTGRNVVLLGKAGVFCATRGLHRLAIGPLAGNPFPDATPEFFRAMASALSLGLGHDIEIVAPLQAMHKDEVIALGRELGVPLELSLSCMNPGDDLHCGRCSKCRERHDAFVALGVDDPTSYAAPRPT